MDLSQSDIDAVRTTYLHLSADQQRAGELFYAHLFEIAPETRDMFLVDVASQATKLMSTLGLVVSQLQNWRDPEPIVEDLAMRHLAYGVQEDHYDAVRQALHAMLADVLDVAYTNEVRRAWDAAYRALAETMVATAYRDRETLD